MLSNTAYDYMDESSINPLLKCKLCKKPFVDPVSTQNGDCFCRPCISQILLRDQTDELSLNDDHYTSKLKNLTPVTEPIVLDMLASLLVRCPDCEETNILRGQLDKHKNEACTQATVLCTAADIKCPWIGARQELGEHLDQCKYEPLRSALEEMFNELAELKTRILNLETQLNE